MSYTEVSEQPLPDWAMDAPPLQTAAADGLARALQRYEEAKADAERTHRICDRWTKEFGIGVWREGHPLDRRKLCARRVARRVLAIEHRALIEALAACHPAGRA